MKLVECNIDRVMRHDKNGVPYLWFVRMKSNRISDTREFVNYVEYRPGRYRTTSDPYPIDRLPKAVQNFIHKHTEELYKVLQTEPDNYEIYKIS